MLARVVWKVVQSHLDGFVTFDGASSRTDGDIACGRKYTHNVEYRVHHPDAG